jgi:hypothetical protein
MPAWCTEEGPAAPARQAKPAAVIRFAAQMVFPQVIQFAERMLSHWSENQYCFVSTSVRLQVMSWRSSPPTQVPAVLYR